MATLTDEITKQVEVGDEVVTFCLRRPKEEEINKFLASRYPTDRKHGMRDNSTQARVAFFDLLLIRVDNLSDSQGPIGPDRKASIPSNWKDKMIFLEFEDVPVVDEKN